MPPERRVTLIRTQLERARSPYENSHDRSQYLIAAANLAFDLADDDADELFAMAMREVNDPAPSTADDFARQNSHPLGSMTFGGFGDSRPAGALLAARMAHKAEQRDAVRRSVVGLIGIGDDYVITRCLQFLGGPNDAELPFLAKEGWGMRSLAAIGWVQNPTAEPDIGLALARDPDVRVRRALANALASRDPGPRTQPVYAVLAIDSRYSVTAALRPK